MKRLYNMLFILILFFVGVNSVKAELSLENNKYTIKTIIDGNGKIEIQDSSESGKEVTFSIKENEGYQLREIRISSSNGNIIIFKDNKFVMPEDDVIIEVSFEKGNTVMSDTMTVNEIKNPNTSSKSLIGLILLLIVCSIGCFISIKKIRFLN